jgi:SNF2 family DNA or RNA helicase
LEDGVSDPKARLRVLAEITRLRRLCCHPQLVAPNAPGESSKIDALMELIGELSEGGHRALVFSQFVSLLELIRPRLAAAAIPYLMLTGQTDNRAELVDKFQADKNQTVFLLSLKAAGFGLNLTAASYVILCDPWWNPAVEAQAIDRTHRIGQTQPVVAYRLVAADTVEQKILAMQREKAALASAVVQEDSLASVLDLDSLRQILS